MIASPRAARTSGTAEVTDALNDAVSDATSGGASGTRVPEVRTFVVGDPIAQSLSPELLAAAGVGIHCERALVPAGQLANFIRSERASDAGGFSVTMPLKREAFAVCDWVSPKAAQVGVINTIVRNGDAALFGDNTDVLGIVAAVRAHFPKRHFTKGVILGSGATAASALAALQALHVPAVTVCARRAPAAGGAVYEAAQRLGVSVQYRSLAAQAVPVVLDTQLLIATLPFRIADPLASQLQAMKADLSSVAILDAAYRPYPSQLTAAVTAAGGTAIPGYEMLIWQGVAQARLFTGREPNMAAMRNAVLAAMPA